MQFEFDEAKSQWTKRERGIDFVEAQALWLDENRVQEPSPKKGEARFRIIGKIGAKHWAALIVYRSERIRIISVRRARKKEIARYEKD
ncbi:MAG: BrnT family toxin [Gemmatimonas sp.]|nr:BrnT family toxin [Gemmatimonas sp.]